MKENAKLAITPGRTEPLSSSVLPMISLCPQDEKLTEQDVRNMPFYTWLLIAEEDGASIEELAASVLRFDLETDRRWAMRVTRSYLERARWVNDRLFPTIR